MPCSSGCGGAPKLEDAGKVSTSIGRALGLELVKGDLRLRVVSVYCPPTLIIFRPPRITLIVGLPMT